MDNDHARKITNFLAYIYKYTTLPVYLMNNFSSIKNGHRMLKFVNVINYLSIFFSHLKYIYNICIYTFQIQISSRREPVARRD